MKACRISAGVGFVLSLIAAISGNAVAADNTIAVLGVEATDGAPDAVAAALTDALRQRASGERGMRLVPGKDLIEVKLIFSCPDEAPSCMADAGKSLGASKMIFGSVKKSLGDSYVVTLKLLDVGRKQIDNWVAEPVSRAQATPGAVRQPVQKWFAQLTGQSAMGTVRIRGDVPGTAVALDGAPVGVIGSDDLVLNGIPAGRREILASKPGYPPVRREVNVVAGSSADVVIEMAATAQAPPATPGPLANPGVTGPILPPPGPDDSTGLRTGTGSDGSKTALQVASWGTLAAAATSFGLAIKFAIDVNDINSELDPYRRFACASDGQVLCTDMAGTIKGMPLTPREQDYVQQLQDEGKRFENLQYVALGVGSVFAIASGVLFYFGYMADDGSVTVGSGPLAPSLSLVPTASPTGGGGMLQLRF
jgi:hypothetical protein